MRVVLEYLQNLWPISVFAFNDLRASDGIVKKLSIPESTKRFVYAIHDPESQAVIYVLSVQNLSQRSALDAACLIREIKPDAVVVQVGNSNDLGGNGMQNGGTGLMNNIDGIDVDVDECTVPTSSFEVLKRCFVYKINKEKYEDIAGSAVLREIFGVNFNEHFVIAKKAAEEVGSSFFMLESPRVKCNPTEGSDYSLGTEAEEEAVNLTSGVQNVFGLQICNFVPGSIGSSTISVNSSAFCITNEIQTQMVKSLSSHLAHLNPLPSGGDEVVQPLIDYEIPQFAKSVYPLLVDLHDIFVDIPSMKTALACAQKMLCDVNDGEVIETRILSEVYAFQIAAEGLRIALNNASRLPISKPRGRVPSNCEFSELPLEEKSHAILAQALQSKSKKCKSIVAVVDASELAGLRKHWQTDIPVDIKDMVESLITNLGDEGKLSDHSKRRLLADKPVVAVGAGATAILGASSISKVIPASTLAKIATFHVPASLKLMFTQTQKAILFTFTKAFGPTKLVVPGMTSSTLKSSAIKATVSAEKIRMVAHSMIASAEKTSLSAMRSSFYEIMRTRRVRPIGALPWATFGFSIATCTGLLVCGDGIECAAESFPVAPSIASLGRGIRSLHEVSQVVKQAENTRIQKSIESLLYKFKNMKIQ